MKVLEKIFRALAGAIVIGAIMGFLYSFIDWIYSGDPMLLWLYYWIKDVMVGGVYGVFLFPLSWWFLGRQIKKGVSFEKKGIWGEIKSL